MGRMNVMQCIESKERLWVQATRTDVRVRTKLPIHEKNPAKNALKGKLPTKRAYIN